MAILTEKTINSTFYPAILTQRQGAYICDENFGLKRSVDAERL